MRKRIIAALGALVFLVLLFPVDAAALQRVETPNYKVAFYAYDAYHMQDENGKRTGYGYELMQELSKYLQCTFSYVGYDKTAAQCEELLRTGQLDIYTAARRTPEREAEFVFTSHPAITAHTYMNVKIDNRRIVAGDYSTYQGIRVGLLRRHTFNDTFLDFVREKGIDCQISYYETPTALSNALISGEVDALVDSYIRIPEDEKSIEIFGEIPYYIMARKEDQPLIDQLDKAFDSMNMEMPNWRAELYNRYYGLEESSHQLTEQEQALLRQLVSEGQVIRAVVNPDANPYSWYENGAAKGIAADIFKATAAQLGLRYKILPVADKEAYLSLVSSGDVDIWIDMDTCDNGEISGKYKATSPYLSTTLSVLRRRNTSEKITRLVTAGDHITLREIAASVWPNAQIIVADSLEECKQKVLDREADAALLMSYEAQQLARDDVKNRLRADIVPGGSMVLRMGVNADISYSFYGLWEKTLAEVSNRIGAEVLQGYLERTVTPTLAQYLYDHPTLLISLCCFAFLLLFVILMYCQSVKSKCKQEKIANELSIALEKAEEATVAKQEFFSKMSHDIRTPLNVVLGMTQIAQKYKNDAVKLENALMNINQEGNYLLVMINSILDVNQLEHGTIELLKQPFNPADCLRECASILQPLCGKKEQTLAVCCDCETAVVRGDVNRLKQILINIISNAIKYTGVSGHIELRLECLPMNRCRFTCTDDGIGMSQEFVEHICEDYTRAEDSRVSKTQGTGLGMSVVKGFTDLMGGQLTIHSELGKGSSFIVELPFDAATDEERRAVLHPVQEQVEKPPVYKGKRVLLVEDNALNAEIAIELLQMIGLTVDWAENGAVGIKRYEESQVDEYFAVFMDMQMPVMDGVTATRLIRASGRADHDIPIFAMTANTFASDRRSCREAGMNGYIPKPVSMKDIETALTEIND